MKAVGHFVLLFWCLFLGLGWLWGKLIPLYAISISSVAGYTLTLIGRPIEYLTVTPQGVWHSSTQLLIVEAGHRSLLDIGKLSLIIPLWPAVVVASFWLSRRQRAVLVSVGSLVMVVSHISFLILGYVYSSSFATNPKVALSLSEVLIFWPILAWAVWSGAYYVVRVKNRS